MVSPVPAAVGRHSPWASMSTLWRSSIRAPQATQASIAVFGSSFTQRMFSHRIQSRFPQWGQGTK